jgi:hypothetical protein
MATLSPEELKKEEQRGARDLRDDPGMLCFLAATEADRLLQGERGLRVQHIGRLKAYLDSYVPRFEHGEARSLAESNTLRAMAISLRNYHASGEIDDLARTAKGLVHELAAIQEHPEQYDADEGKNSLKDVKRFCLDFSRQLRSVGFPPDMEAYIRRERSKEEARREAT